MRASESAAPIRAGRFQFITIAAILLIACISGCRVASDTANLPARAVGLNSSSRSGGQSDMALLQVELQRFSDEYATRTVNALNEFVRIKGTDEARSQALRWKLAANASSLSIASGPNPHANMLDFLALTSVTRMALEEVWTKTADGHAFQPWLQTSTALDNEAWELASGVLTPQQQQEMRDVIRKWWDENPTAHSGFFVHPQQFSSFIRDSKEKAPRPGSIFGLVGLDPTAGLDPAVREVTRTRLFAERAMFMLQRMPRLVSWQIEVTVEDILRQAQVTRTLDSIERLSKATESISQTAAQLPDQLAAERKAILDAAHAQEGKLRELSAEITRTLEAGQSMSASLNTTITTFDSLMQRFGVGEPDSASAQNASTVPGAGAAVGAADGSDVGGFQILDYAKTAQQITAMSKELNQVLTEFNTTLNSPALGARLQAVNAVSDHTAANLRGLLYQLFILTAALVLLIFTCAWLLRATRRKQNHRASAP